MAFNGGSRPLDKGGGGSFGPQSGLKIRGGGSPGSVTGFNLVKGISFGCSRIELSGLITLSYIILHHFLCLGLKNYKLAKRENFSKRLLFTKSSAHCKIHLHINGNKLQRRRAVVFPVYLNTIRFNIYQFISSVLRFNVIFCLFSLFYSSF